MSIEFDAGQMVFGCYNRLGMSHPSEATLKQKLADSKIGGVLIAMEPARLRASTRPSSRTIRSVSGGAPGSSPLVRPQVRNAGKVHLL